MLIEVEEFNPGAVLKAHTWEELQELLESRFCAARWVFRGQRDAGWPLRTSFERACENVDRAQWKRAEAHLLLQFQRRLHQYESIIPDVDDTLEWLALMQHHGAPTRLLDWTKSPFVGVYFAVEASAVGHPCSVWIFNRQAMHNDVLEKMPELLSAMSATKTGTLSDKEVFNKYVFSSELLGVVAVEPFRMNERLTVQQGLFLVPTSVNSTFLSNLKGGPVTALSSTPHLYRIDLDPTYRERLRILEELRKMNIHRASLFPGIDGFAQSLATEIEIWGGFDENRILLDGNYNEYF